eukprot:scaffold41839_cov71-Phaeocystis_antarctica.AAC.4
MRPSAPSEGTNTRPSPLPRRSPAVAARTQAALVPSSSGGCSRLEPGPELGSEADPGADPGAGFGLLATAAAASTPAATVSPPKATHQHALSWRWASQP